ncbi:HIT-like protein [Glarea lozoyensis ATCC 20868]|uniref:Bis(5'-adenosyl)-triphosphatase n=1 Tax=Glarea lozoyensis (strain ATCC 20868 / MF5171) TaxID=1116229 RepID=S3DMX6_GLAL2|nr:HIT-like protein [Glarea lozoyensis ATCC 20868]EPE27838.1 HIT-like protein [Glarea lozoyensis ATCC 20868]
MEQNCLPEDLESSPRIFYQFVVTQQMFYHTSLSFAFVNIKPLLPGHVLVSPCRIVPRLSDLTREEVTDLFITVQRVGRMLERVYSASALNIPIQDGWDAGQSVPHLHVHLVPRTPSDLDSEGGPDAIYDRLEGVDGDLMQQFRRLRPRQPNVDEDSLEARSVEVMKQEADMLRLEMQRDLTSTKTG